MNAREKGLGCKVVVNMDPSIGQVSIVKPDAPDQPPKSFTFDGVYFMDSITENIYNEIVFPLVEGVIEGYNGTVFAYGQTGCGKSFTMQGIPDPPTQRGLTPRAFEHIFESVQTEDNAKYLIHASYLEIYNEEIRDLMGKDHKNKLDVKEHPDRGVYVKDLTMVPCHSVSDMERVMDVGGKSRHVGATLMNADSSRSHSIFTIFVETCETGPDGQEHIRAGKLNLVDLAGSERQAKTGASGTRLKEATKINLSLSALGNVISALVDGKAKHIPYRDSKLTRLLQDSLGGNTKTLMASCISPADNNYDETLSTLRYANRAKNIKNKPKINEDPKDALLRQYQSEIEMLKKMLMGQIEINPDLLASLGMSDTSSAAVSKRPMITPVPPVHDKPTEEKTEALAAEADKIRKEYEEKLSNLQSMFEKEQSSKQKLQEELDKLEKEYSDKLDKVQEQYDHVSEAEKIVNDFEKQNEANIAGAKQSEEVGEGATYDDGAKAFKVKQQHTPSLIQQIQKEAMKVQNDALKGIGSLKNKLSGSQQELAVSVSKKDGQLSDPDFHVPEQQISTSSTGGKISEVAQQLQEEAMRRLQSLQEQLVGGEKRNDQNLKEKRKARKQYAQSKREKLMKAVENMEDDGIMVKVYDNLQDEVKVKNKKIDKLTEELKAASIETKDLQAEFERDRQDYLDTIRKMEQTVQLQKQMMDKIQPCIRRDCNYYNLDKIRSAAEWDESHQTWILPDLVVEKTVLPSGVVPGARGNLVGQMPGPIKKQPLETMNGDGQSFYNEANEEDRFRKHLNNNANEDFSQAYFKAKRPEKLLHASSSIEIPRKKEGDSQQRTERVAQMNGNVTPTNSSKTSLPRTLEPIPRPAKLESLPPSAFQKKKKRK